MLLLWTLLATPMRLVVWLVFSGDMPIGGF